MDQKKKNKVIVLLISILIIIILAIILSYALFSTTLSGNENIVRVGTLDLILNETSEGLNLSDVVGVSDEEGMSSSPSTFELVNNGNKAVDYTIYLDDMNIESTEKRMEDKYLKYNLVKNDAASGAKSLASMGSNPNRVLDTGTISGNGKNTYKLNLWITDELDGGYLGTVFKGKLRVVVKQSEGSIASDTILANVGDNGSTYDDGTDTFITGTDPNNYVWYSGKLWRAVSVNKEAKTTKLVTQWNISAISYNPENNSSFEGSYMKDWLNDTSVDGFLGNLRNYENYIDTNSKWDASTDDSELGSVQKPNGTTMVEDAVGLLNTYEYQSSNNGGTDGYLNNELDWWTLTPNDKSFVNYLHVTGDFNTNGFYSPSTATGVRPSINLKSDVKIVDGDGTVSNPYRLNGDNDTNLSGTLLSTRYSGEYIRFGSGVNNLYRIVSHETDGLTKIVSAQPLKSSSTFITSAFGSNNSFSSSNTMGTFLNGEYLTSYVDSTYSNMIEDETAWYLGAVGNGASYKLAKYTDTNMSNTTTSTTSAKVGLLRFGELMSGQFDENINNTDYWLLTPSSESSVRRVTANGDAYSTSSSNAYGVRPSLNLKSNVVITSGDGTKNNPFTIELSS